MLEKLGFRRISTNHSIFITEAGLNGLIVRIFVDNIKIIGTKGSGFIRNFKVELTVIFSMIDIGPISLYLGLKVTRDWKKKTIKLLQSAYINKIPEKFYFSGANMVNCPTRELILLIQCTKEEKEASPLR